jgi:hypothetical protein
MGSQKKNLFRCWVTWHFFPQVSPLYQSQVTDERNRPSDGMMKHLEKPCLSVSVYKKSQENWPVIEPTGTQMPVLWHGNIQFYHPAWTAC